MTQNEKDNLYDQILAVTIDGPSGSAFKSILIKIVQALPLRKEKTLADLQIEGFYNNPGDDYAPF